jgi:hypothetical protein
LGPRRRPNSRFERLTFLKPPGSAGDIYLPNRPVFKNLAIAEYQAHGCIITGCALYQALVAESSVALPPVSAGVAHAIIRIRA